MLEQALPNLAANAIKWNCEDGRIHFRLFSENSHARLQVANAGPGISEADRERVFARFFAHRHIRG